MGSSLTLSIPRDFSLEAAVCSYGYFHLAPNHWEAGELHRPLRDAAGGIVSVRVTQRRASGAAGRLTIRCDRSLDAADRALVKAQLGRMLRLDEDFSVWRKLHRDAVKVRFARLFRSPTLFEDVIKTITSCNVSWGGTKTMNTGLVEHVGGGDFPTPGELAAQSPRRIQQLCRAGYRAERIVRFARDVHEGRIDLTWFEQPDRSLTELDEALRRIHGVGPYAANNILQHLGRYDRLPVDSELIRHLRDRHSVEGSLAAVTRAAHRIYDRYAPYQFLAYWFELWTDYRRSNRQI